MAEEKNFENKIKKFLKNQNGWYIKYWAGSAYTKSGIPDLLCAVHGRFLAVEVKATKGKPSELQLYNLREIEKSGGFAFLLYPSGWDDFKKFVEEMELKDFDQLNSEYQLIKGW